MAYDSTLPAGGPGNFVSPNTAHEADGVEVDFITVDYINAMNAEVTHPGASANTAGLQLAMEAIKTKVLTSWVKVFCQTQTQNKLTW